MRGGRVGFAPIAFPQRGLYSSGNKIWGFYSSSELPPKHLNLSLSGNWLFSTASPLEVTLWRQLLWLGRDPIMANSYLLVMEVLDLDLLVWSKPQGGLGLVGMCCQQQGGGG